MFIFAGFACASAQVYQVGQDAPKSPRPTPKNPPSPQQQGEQPLGWGSNIQNARFARAAELALQRGDKAQAVEYAQRAAQAAPNDPQLWFLLGYAARLAQQLQLSLDAYNRGLALSPGSADGASGLAQVYSVMGHTEEAEKLLRQVISADPRRRNDAVMLGELYLRARDYNSALEWLDKAERLQPDPRSELLMALSYLQLKQMDKASEYLEMAKRRAPGNPEVERALAGYYRATGNYPDAITALKAIRNPQPDVLAEMGYTYQLDGELSESARLYKQAATALPRDIGFQLSAAQAQVAAGSIEEANALLKHAETLDANAYRLHAIRGEIAQIQENPDQALLEYEKAISNLPDAPAEGPLYGIQLHMNLVALNHILDNEDAAHRELEIAQNQIKTVDPTTAGKEQYLRLRSMIKLNAGDADGALTDVQGALASNPKDRNNLQLNGDVLMKLGRTDDAIAVYKQILDQDSRNRFALTSLGYAERTAGRDQESEKYFLRLAQVDPDLFIPYLALGDLYTARRDFAKAQTNYGKAFALAQKNALIIAGGMNAAIEAHDLKLASLWMARVSEKMSREPQILRETERYLTFNKDYGQSATVGEQAIKVLPKDRDVVVYLGYDLLYLHRYDDLLALTTKYMDVFSKDADIPLLQGYVHKHNGESEVARDNFSEAIKRNPGAETAYVNRGYMLNDLHHPEDAAADFETALKLDPNDGQAHLGLAYSNLDLHKSELALRQAALAEKSMGDIRDLHVIRATAYASQSQSTRAATEYRAALKFTPNDGALRLGLGNTLMAMRRYHAAINELELAAQLSPENPQPYALLASCYASLQDHDQAIHFADLAEQLVQSAPGPVQSQVYLTTGEALSNLGDQSAAMDHFRKALEVRGSDRVAVRLAIAGLMSGQEQPEGAQRQVALALMEAETGETSPPTGPQYLAAADVFRSAHEYELSQNYLQRAKAAGAPDPQVRIGLANNYLALGDTARAQAELAAVSAAADSDPNYQYLMAEASVRQQEHQNAEALTSFAQAADAAGGDPSAERAMLQAGADEGLRITPNLSVLSNYSIQPIYEDSTVYVLDSKLDAATPIPSTDTSLLPPPRSSLQNQWTNAFHIHWRFLPTPTGFFQIRNARGEISAPSSQCGPGTTSASICSVVINRNTTDYNLNFGLNPTFHLGRNAVSFNGGVQGTFRRDKLQPAEMNQNLLRLFLYGSTNALFNAVTVSGYVIHEAGPFTLSDLHSRTLTGAVDFRIGSPWGKTALLTGWGASDQNFTPRTYEAFFTSAYIGFEHRFSDWLNLRALAEDLRAWRVVEANSGTAQNLRPAATVDLSPRRGWDVKLYGSYSSTRSFHVYDAVQSSISVSYAMPIRRRYSDESGPVTLAYPIRFSGGVQNETFFNFSNGQHQLRPYFEISIF